MKKLCKAHVKLMICQDTLISSPCKAKCDNEEHFLKESFLIAQNLFLKQTCLFHLSSLFPNTKLIKQRNICSLLEKETQSSQRWKIL